MRAIRDFVEPSERGDCPPRSAVPRPSVYSPRDRAPPRRGPWARAPSFNDEFTTFNVLNKSLVRGDTLTFRFKRYWAEIGRGD
jgi:hypothetical protein